MSRKSQLPDWLLAPYEGLVARFAKNQLGHAPLLHGPQGVGKELLAECLARTILCENPSGSPVFGCGDCKSCRLIDSGSHPDRFDLMPAESGKAITVDQVRALIEQMTLTPAIGRYRLGVIAPAESLNVNAANALLKSLEEPPDNVWLILVSHQHQRLLPTILSRCQKVAIGVPAQSESLSWLESNASTLDSSVCDLALRMSAGAPLLALEYIESGQVVEAKAVLEELLGIANGGGVSPDLAERWAADASNVWAWLAFWVGEFAKPAAKDGVESPWAGLSDHPDRIDWAPLWKGTLEGRAMSVSGVRQDLLLGSWLLLWEGFFTQP